MAAPTQDLPLQQELGLVNYFRNITGTQGSGGAAVAGQASEIDSQGLQNIMTEWLRGNGQFLEKMHQQNQSGLYNSSTRRLVANDLTAQAALKAATASSQVSVENAKMQTQASIANAAAGKSTGNTKDALMNTALAAAIAAYNSKKKGDEKSASPSASSGAKGTGASSRSADASDVSPSATFQMPEAPQQSFAPEYVPLLEKLTGEQAPQFSTAPVGYDALAQFTAAGADFNAPTGGSDFNLGVGDNYDYPDYSSAPMDYSSDTQDYSADNQDYSFDFGGSDEWGW